jgi:hypothetical protein
LVTLFLLVVSWQRISTQKLALQITMKSSCGLSCSITQEPRNSTELHLLLLLLLLLSCQTLLISTLYEPRTENTPRDNYAASPLARWLLPCNGFCMDLQKTCHVTATNCCVTSPQTQMKHCFSIVGRLCVAGVA